MPAKVHSETTRFWCRVPTTIYLILKDSRLSFGPGALEDVLANAASDLDLHTIPLPEMDRFETTKVLIALPEHVYEKYAQAAPRRGCLLEVMLNAGLRWLDRWWDASGVPEAFTGICEILACDDIMNSGGRNHYLMDLYLRGDFDSPPKLLKKPVSVKSGFRSQRKRAS